MYALKKHIKKIIASPYGWRLYSLLFRKPGVTVLMYHRIVKDSSIFHGIDVSCFSEQMHWLKKNCTLIKPEDLTSKMHCRNEPKPSVLITFDDGYRDYHDNAYPILHELKIPALLFVSTLFIDQGGIIWTDLVTWAAHASIRDHVQLPWCATKQFKLSEGPARGELVAAAKAYLKDIPDVQRKLCLDELFRELDVSVSDYNLERQMMTWDEVRATIGLTQIGGHSHTHPILSQLPMQQMEDEIRICRDRIRAETGIQPKYFAYPNGRTKDFNETTKELLTRYGFELTFSTVAGINGKDADRMAIRRQSPGNGIIGHFACIVAGL